MLSPGQQLRPPRPMALTDSWHIKSRSHECSVTAKPFEEDEVFYTALFPDPESDGYLRKDFSSEAWDGLGEEDEKPFSFWRAVYKPPEHVESKEELIEQDDPEALLSRLVEEDEEHTENARYILAVMLERKKLLVETDSQKTRNGLLRIYEHRHSGEVFIIKDPQIPLSEVSTIQDEVQQLLSPKPPEAEEGETADVSQPASDDEAGEKPVPDEEPAEGGDNDEEE